MLIFLLHVGCFSSVRLTFESSWMNNYSVSIRAGVSRIFLTLAKFWVMFILWINAALAVLVFARRGAVFTVLSGFIILIALSSTKQPNDDYRYVVTHKCLLGPWFGQSDLRSVSFLGKFQIVDFKYLRLHILN